MMITEILLSIFAIATVCFMVGGGILAYSYEKKAWNNGTCQETGQKWKSFERIPKADAVTNQVNVSFGFRIRVLIDNKLNQYFGL